MNLSTIVKPCHEKVFKRDNIFCVYDAQHIDRFSPQMLDNQYWQSQNAIVGSAQGRGTTWFVQHEEKQWVLRHYYRGGMIGKFNKDNYWFTRMESTRAAREFTLLNRLVQLNLPVPCPIAYRVIRKGRFYQADILSERICDAKDLVALLCEKEISLVLWQKIGATIKRFHNNNIYHHDLNAHNILIDKEENVWLIDFDRGEIRSGGVRWKKENMKRLLRSFNKEKNKLAGFHWQESHWDALMSGYIS